VPLILTSCFFANPDSDVMVMHYAEERITANAADPLNCGQDRVNRRIE
jgi:hypothetical protein